jgi:hypothetical protein
LASTKVPGVLHEYVNGKVIGAGLEACAFEVKIVSVNKIQNRNIIFGLYFFIFVQQITYIEMQ